MSSISKSFFSNLILPCSIFDKFSKFLAKVTKDQASQVKISEEHEDFIWLEINPSLSKMKIKSNRVMLKKAYEYIKKIEDQQKLK